MKTHPTIDERKKERTKSPTYPSLPTPNPKSQITTNLKRTATMQLTTLILSSLCLASTAFAAPPLLLLTKRQIYTIDGEPNTDFHLAYDDNGRPIRG